MNERAAVQNKGTKGDSMQHTNHPTKIRSLGLVIVGALGLLLAWLGFLTASPDAALAQTGAGIIRVAKSGSDVPGCGSVVSPCASLQYAVDQALAGEEIRVAAGLYTGLQGRFAPSNYAGPSVVTQVVYLSKSLTLRGGYTVTDWSAPNPISYSTVLDAEDGGRVFFIAGDAISVTVQGFHIVGGYSQNLGGGSASQDVGSGVYAITSTLTVQDNHVYDNNYGRGVGLYAAHSDIWIGDNVMYDNDGTIGAGVNLYYSHATLDGNTFRDNSTAFGGGGVYLAYSTALLSRNIITGNQATHPLYGRGGGIRLFNNISATLVNNLIAENRASRSNSAGSGILIEDSSARLMHNTIARNTGGDGSGLALTSVSSACLTNTILVSQAIGIKVEGDAVAQMEATLWGTGPWANGVDWDNQGTLVTGSINLWDEPGFVAPDGGDYHIQATSAAVDAGLNLGVKTDIDNEPRPVNPQSDIGADEYSPGCYARLNDQDFVYSSVQAAVDASAHPTDVVKVAGYCFGVQERAGVTQTLYLSKTLTIRGGYDKSFGEPPDPTANHTTLNARGEGRVVYVSGAPIGPSIEGLRLIGGSASGLGGGPGEADAGGGVYVAPGDARLSLQNNWLLGSQAQMGGGLFWSGDEALLVNNVIADNQASGGGSGAYLGGGSVRLSHTTLARNREGAGLYVVSGTAALTNTVLVSHPVGVHVGSEGAVGLEATLWGAGPWANGVDWDNQGALVTGTVNLWDEPGFVAPDGGDYHLRGKSPARDAGVAPGLDLSQDIDGERRSMGQGYDLGADEYRSCWARLNDGPYDYFTVQEAVDDSTSTSDVVKVAGTCTDLSVRSRADVTSTGMVTQVVYLSKTLTLRGGYTLTDWLASDPQAHPTALAPLGAGRALYVSGDGRPTVQGLHLTGGDASGLGGEILAPEIDAGGGLYLFSTTLTLDQCRIWDNQAQVGGGVYVASGSLLLSHSDLLSNTVPASGGGLYLATCDNAALEDNTIAGNWANSGGGGYLRYCPVSLEGNVIQGNQASGNGGGLYVWSGGSEVWLDDNDVSNNRAGQWGGGLHLWDSRQVTLQGNDISDNLAQEYGGGLWLNFSQAALYANTFCANTAPTGGGAYLRASHARLSNNVIAANQADVAGSGLYLSGAQIWMWHNTLASNGGNDGSGIYAVIYEGSPGLPSSLWLTNTILADQAMGLWVTAGNTATLEASLWDNVSDWGGGGAIYTGTRNYWGDPAFVDPGTGDYHLGAGSAAIDKAVATTVTTDLDGEYRPGDGNDLGADEYPWSLQVSKGAEPDPVQAGAQLTYTLRLTSTGSQPLTTTVSDQLPAQLSAGGPLSWTVPNLNGGDVWIQQVIAEVELGYAGPLTNVVWAISRQGPADAHTDISESRVTPALTLSQQVKPDPVQAGARLTYTLRVTNVGNVDLNATITDLLPAQVSPAGPLVWTAFITAPYGSWAQQAVVTVEQGYAGPLVNTVQVGTVEGAMGLDTLTSRAQAGSVVSLVYLPVVLRASP